MTREELKNHCEEQIKHCEMWAKNREEEPHGNIYEEHKLILELLEQESCEDAVSRKELLKIYDDRFIELQKIKHLKDNKGAEDRQLGVNYCINILKELPPVTPTRKKGKWINKSHKSACKITVAVTECSCCGKKIPFNCDEFIYRYCPYCGAEMEGEE